MWQKGRELDVQGYVGPAPGRTVWVQGPPIPPDGSEITGMTSGESSYRTTFTFLTNIVDPTDGERLRVEAVVIELLPEFADDVPLITWEEFIKYRGKE